ncbi:hypothetical protein CS063_08285 [Sporanaerobium hydrogeniformans]|uniref:Uncharacterized protein n=1 Tax=Sporanaerobium hydrogeniformans TaxID=3072179 RepID=A0AC61DDT8_9FIRM|nr:DUF3881 family protein [Sporanaerobium hydrogeniformans]PHV70757.1 hypothetical protein CS063_08285 [Sporanaerobium hydrogeniformans]
MEAPITAIGFSKIVDEDKLQEMVKEILDKPTIQLASKTKSKEILGEYYKKYGENTYLMVRIVVRSEKKDAKIEVEQCEPYVEARHCIEVEELTVECIDDDYSYYAICEEKETGMPFIFWLQNVIDYTEANSENKKFNKVKVVGLATEGTIVLPIERDEEEESIEKEEREKFKVMVQRAREGDEEAKELLEKEEKELDEQLKERMLEEDFLSIMSGYFVPTTLEDAIYAILGEIKEIHIRKNMKTKEEMYLFVLNVNDMPLEVMINKKILIGEPSIGMRFMGTCWLQGTVIC